MRRGVGSTITASPTMVGAVTTLIVIVAVFLAYNANAGLPFVPVYRVSVEVPDAARLINNNEVRIGGHRVGVVESIDAIQGAAQPGDAPTAEGDTSGVVARLNLKLEKDVEPLPKNSVFRVRYRSAFGLKYVEIIRGNGETAPEGYVFDGTDDAELASAGSDSTGEVSCHLPGDPQFGTTDGSADGCFQTQTEFDDIANTFDAKTRNAVRTNLIGFGDAFAGRGTSLNDAIAGLDPLFKGLRPVTKVLIAPDTRLRRFFPALGNVARIVAPVAEQQADLFTKAGLAFAAISSDVTALQETIVETAPTEETGIRLLPRLRPFLTSLATLGRELQPGAADLRATLPVLNDAIEVGTPVLADSPPSNRRLEQVLRALNGVVSQPTTSVALRRLTDTFDTAKPLAKYVVPAQTVCSYFDYWATFLPGALSDRDQVGYSFRQSLTRLPLSAGVDAPADGYSGAQSNGLDAKSLGGVFKPYENPIINAHPYGPAGQKNADCQGGQSGYALGQGLLPGQSPSNPAYATSDQPGTRGPTTLFYNDDNQRELRDTRNAARQPQTWERVGG